MFILILLLVRFNQLQYFLDKKINYKLYGLKHYFLSICRYINNEVFCFLINQLFLGPLLHNIVLKQQNKFLLNI